MAFHIFIFHLCIADINSYFERRVYPTFIEITFSCPFQSLSSICLCETHRYVYILFFKSLPPSHFKGLYLLQSYLNHFSSIYENESYLFGDPFTFFALLFQGSLWRIFPPFSQPDKRHVFQKVSSIDPFVLLLHVSAWSVHVFLFISWTVSNRLESFWTRVNKEKGKKQKC